MKHTIFNTPGITDLLYSTASLLLKLFGWRAEGRPPNIRKFLATAAPHTSNWDFVLVLLIAMKLRVNVKTLVKKEYFEGLVGHLFHFLGAIPVDRHNSSGLVGQIAERIRSADQIVLIIAPSGTRNKVQQWKSGFYFMALEGNVPIVPGYLDYKRKAGGFGPMISLTGDIGTDIARLKAFYSDKTPKYPEKAMINL